MSGQVTVILRAAEFAARKHWNQRRKGGIGRPYINHPLEVAAMLAVEGGVTDHAILAAAILHDTVEDTDTTPEEIESEFGAEIRGLVAEVTDDKSLEKQTRKHLQVLHAPHLSPGAKVIKLADKISNVREIVNDPPSDWTLERRREYLAWGSDVVAGLRGVNAALERRYDEVVAEGLAVLGRA